MDKSTIDDTIEANIVLPKKLYELICAMAKAANEELKTDLTGEQLISKQTVQYFGTKNSLEIMSFSLQKLPDLLKDEKEQILKLNKDFNQLLLDFDKISKESNQLFHKVIDQLEKLQ